MFSQKALLLAFGLLTVGVTIIDAKCRECSITNYAMCTRDNTFKVCPDGRNPSGEDTLCPDNQVCTAEVGVCKPKASATPECGICGDCMNGFACISKIEFEYCDGPNRTGLVFKCLTDEYCSLENLAANKSICVKSCAGDPTCFKEVVIPKPDYAGICANTTVPGNYANTYDSKCKTYVHCEKLKEVMNWILLSCAEGSYFDKADKKCTTKKPSYCT